MSLVATAPEITLDSRQLLAALRAFRRGDFSVRLPLDLTGLDGELAEAFNDVVELNDRMSREFSRLGEVVGRQGKITNRARVPGATGSWAASVDAVNTLIEDMVHPTAEMARVIGAVAKGDLGQTMDLENEDRPRSTVQDISSRPLSLESAPYFAALVASSWMANDSDMVDRAVIPIGSPPTWILAGLNRTGFAGGLNS